MLGFLFVPDPLVFLSVSKDLICCHAPLQTNNRGQEGGGVLLGTAEEAESRGGSQASMTQSKESSPCERREVKEME